MELLTVDDLTRMTHKSRKAIYADVARGLWPYIKLGRRVFFRPETIDRFLESHERPAIEPPGPDGRKRGDAA